MYHFLWFMGELVNKDNNERQARLWMSMHYVLTKCLDSMYAVVVRLNQYTKGRLLDFAHW